MQPKSSEMASALSLRHAVAGTRLQARGLVRGQVKCIRDAVGRAQRLPRAPPRRRRARLAHLRRITAGRAGSALPPGCILRHAMHALMCIPLVQALGLWSTPSWRAAPCALLHPAPHRTAPRPCMPWHFHVLVSGKFEQCSAAAPWMRLSLAAQRAARRASASASNSGSRRRSRSSFVPNP